MPKIPSRFSKCVFYLFSSPEAAQEGLSSGGTGFLVGTKSRVLSGASYVFAVTNWHVAVRDNFPTIRINKKDGTADILDVGPDQWFFEAGGYDLCITPLVPNPEVHDVTWIGEDMFATEAYIATHEIGPGEDVFMCGRFVDHESGELNVPALRFGNISMMPQNMPQPNQTTNKNYFIDVHSRTGFSGSPVFVYRTIGQDLSIVNTGQIIVNAPTVCALLGIHWGQVPEMWEIIAAKSLPISEQNAKIEVLNSQWVKGWSGMTCVAPASAISRLFELPVIKSYIDTNDEMIRQQQISKPIPAAE